MVLWIILGILILFFTWLLLAPIYLYISTPEKRYEAGLTGIARFRLVVPDGKLPEIHARIIFYPFSIPIFTEKAKKEKKKKEKKKGKKRTFTLRKVKFITRLVWKMIRSFRLKNLYLNIDTGDVVRNAYLIPAFSVNFHKNIRLMVNFRNTNELVIHYENTIGRLLKHIILSYINHFLKR